MEPLTKGLENSKNPDAPIPPAWGLNETIEHIINEKQRVVRLGRIRQIVFGSLDALLISLGVL